MAEHRREGVLFLAILFALLAGGCSPSKQNAAQIVRSDFVLLEPGRPVGQTFTAQFAGLNGVMVILKPVAGSTTEPAADARVRFSLRNTPGGAPLRQGTLALSHIQHETYYALTFPPLPDSSQKDYYLELDLQGAEKIKVGTAGPDTYLKGGLTLAGLAQPAQLTFNLLHSWPALALGLLQEGFGWLVLLLAAAFLFVLPGAALLKACWPGWPTSWWMEKLGLSLGVSLAFYPVLLLWTKLAGLHLGRGYAWLPPLAALAWLAWDGRRTLAQRWHAARQPGFVRTRLALYAAHPGMWHPSVWHPGGRLPDALLIALLCLGLASRMWAIRTLDFPMWGDAYQHTMMAQLIVDNGGLFDSWQPYAEMSTFTYHFGFHTATALLHWMTGVELRLAALWMGQIINGLAALALIPLALRLQRSRWTAVAAAALVGLVFMVPMVYTNWGRYTQLAGQLILPVAIYLVWEGLDDPETGLRQNWRRHILSWITLCGLALTHYRVLIFGAMFYPAYFLLNAFSRPVSVQVKRMLWSGVGAAILFLPWIWNVLAGKIFEVAGAVLSTPAVQIDPAQAEALIAQTIAYVPPFFWLAMLAAFGWAVWRGERRIVIVVLWWLFNLLVTNPQWFWLGGQGMINNFTLLIAAYIPIGLVVAAAVGRLAQFLAGCLSHRAPLPAAVRTLGWTGLAAVLLLSGSWLARQRTLDIQPAYGSLATRADLRAAEWIRRSLPAEAVFLVNSFSAYDGTSIVGSDGGWWLPLLTGRRTTLPPLTYVSEQVPRPDYRTWINALTEAINTAGVLSPQVHSMLAERGITHVYLGQRQGSVNNPPGGIKPELLLSDPNFHLVYHQDQVYIFAFTP